MNAPEHLWTGRLGFVVVIDDGKERDPVRNSGSSALLVKATQISPKNEYPTF